MKERRPVSMTAQHLSEKGESHGVTVLPMFMPSILVSDDEVISDSFCVFGVTTESNRTGDMDTGGSPEGSTNLGTTPFS